MGLFKSLFGGNNIPETEKEKNDKKNLLTASLQQKPIKAVRFTNMQHQEQEIYLRRFIITIDK